MRGTTTLGLVKSPHRPVRYGCARSEILRKSFHLDECLEEDSYPVGCISLSQYAVNYPVSNEDFRFGMIRLRPTAAHLRQLLYPIVLYGVNHSVAPLLGWSSRFAGLAHKGGVI